MGGGSYSFSARSNRASTKIFETASTSEIFKARSINNAMEPYGIDVRECKDSEEHPNTVPIIIALDVTGSMGSLPHYLIKEGLPHIMQKIFDAGIKDPQILFLAIGDHKYDSAPLQVGQFESSDELLDTWLTNVYLERGGGANEGESYLLAWYFASKHTSIDSFEKRGKKGILFTIGDEPTLSNVPANKLKEIMGGDGEFRTFTADELLEEASAKWNTFHLHIGQTRAGMIQSTIDGWKQLMGEGLIEVAKREDVSEIIADKVVECVKGVLEKTEEPTPTTSETKILL